MHDERLRIYLNDHLAAVVGELELAKRCRRNNQANELGECLEQWISGLEGQQHVMRQILERIDGSESPLKQGAAWLSEKAARFKLNDSLVQYSVLSRVVEIESLIWAAHGRMLLWETLAQLAPADARLAPFQFEQLREQSENLLGRLQRHRRWAVQQAFLTA